MTHDATPARPTHDWNRWHAHPTLRNCGDTGMAHQMRVAQIVMEWWPGDKYLAACAAVHDAPEALLGDPPYPAMVTFPEYARAYRRAHKALMAAWGLPMPRNKQERIKLLAADIADHVIFAAEQDPKLTKSHEWRATRRRLSRLLLMPETNPRAVSGRIESILCA